MAALRSDHLLKFSVIFIIVYLAIRDGWVLVLLARLPSFVRPSHLSSYQARREISPAVLAKIDEAVFRARTPVALPDYALAADGGIVVGELTSPFDASDKHFSPALVLSDDTHIGQCWSFPGAGGQIGINTADIIHPTHVSIDHIPKAVAADISSAPRRMILWGVVDGVDNEERYKRLAEGTNHALRRNHPPTTKKGYRFVELADFIYNITIPQDVQTFPVRGDIRDVGMDVGIFVLEVVDNWGGEYTCVYRIRIHGEPSDGGKGRPPKS